MTYGDYLFWMTQFCLLGVYLGMGWCEFLERREG